MPSTPAGANVALIVYGLPATVSPVVRLYAAVTRRRLGALVTGDRGRDLRRQADEWMATQDVRNPALLTRMFAPGFPDDDVSPVV